MTPVDPRAFRDVCAQFATGVAAVTSFGREGPAGMTANALASLSLDPPMMVVCFDRASRTLAAVEHSRRFGIHFLARDQEQIAAALASKLPEREKFDGIEWDERSRIPAPAGCIGGLACELRELAPGGDHLIALGEVVDIWAGEGEPLVFFEGCYWQLGGRVVAPADVDRVLEGP